MDEQIVHDFERARHRAFLNDLRAYFRRESNDLIPFHEVRKRMSPEGESYRGIQAVPIKQIVGSEDRFRDFDRAFLPRQAHTASRWKNIDRAYLHDIRLPPIQLYQVGNVYFVKDGNHRVSVAREKGVEFIDAEVIESHIRVPLYAAMLKFDMRLSQVAATLGAKDATIFWRVFFPVTFPALAAGMVLVFILSLGFFITPAILGGGKVPMVANAMDLMINRFSRWEMAAVVSVMLLAFTLTFYAFYQWLRART